MIQQREKAARNPRDELTQYLQLGVESPEATPDVVAWWGVCPTLFLCKDTEELIQRYGIEAE